MTKESDLKQFGEMIATATHKAHMKTLKEIGIMILVGVALSTAIGFISGDFDKDSTDGQERSGLKLHRDQLTGCEYLSTLKGSLYPRLTGDGSQSGCKTGISDDSPF